MWIARISAINIEELSDPLRFDQKFQQIYITLLLSQIWTEFQIKTPKDCVKF